MFSKINHLKSEILFLLFFLFILPLAGFPEVQDADTIYKKYKGILLDGLNSTEVTLKVEAIKILPELNDKSLVPELKKFLKDKSDIVKIEASKSLFKFKDKSGAPVLAGILKNRVKVSPSDPPVKRAKAMAKNMVCAEAASVLGEIGDVSVIPLLKEAAKERGGQIKDAAIVSLIKLGDKTEGKVIISGLSSYEAAIRQRACEILGDIREETVKEKLRDLLKHWDKGVRQAAVVALGKLGDKQYGEDIRMLLNDKEEVVRMGAAEALGYLGDVKFIPQLKEALSDKNGFVRLNAIESLYKMGDDSGESFIINTLSTEDTDARLKSVRILAVYSKPNVVEFLDDAFNNERSELVRLNIAGAVIRILNRGENK